MWVRGPQCVGGGPPCVWVRVNLCVGGANLCVGGANLCVGGANLCEGGANPSALSCRYGDDGAERRRLSAAPRCFLPLLGRSVPLSDWPGPRVICHSQSGNVLLSTA